MRRPHLQPRVSVSLARRPVNWISVALDDFRRARLFRRLFSDPDDASVTPMNLRSVRLPDDAVTPYVDRQYSGVSGRIAILVV